MNSISKILAILMIGSVSLNAAPKIAIHRVYQKVVEATGQPYGSPGGIYFKYTDLEPFIMYGLQYSYDMKTWTDMYNFGTVGISTTSPLIHWDELPPGKCFFRIVVKW
jgi:hypothetical protein